MKLWLIKNRHDRFAEDVVKRFIEGEVKRATTFDFHIPLESDQKWVKLTAPSRFFPRVKDYPLWIVVGSEVKGIASNSC